MKAKQIQYEPLRGSIVLLIARLVLAIVLLEALDFAFSYTLNISLNLPFDWHHHISIGLLIVEVVKILIQVYFILFLVLHWVNTVYLITDKHLIKREGILKVRESIFDFDNVRSIKTEQSLLGKLFDYGDITLKTSASGGYQGDIVLTGIAQPQRCEQLLKECF